MADDDYVVTALRKNRKLFDKGKLVCLHEKPLFANGRSRKFCYSCVPKPPSKERKPYTLKGSKVLACGVCGNLFEQRVFHQQYCSAACRNHQNSVNTQTERRDHSARRCVNCGTVFTPEYGDLRRKYCSNLCKLKHEYKIKSGSTHRRRAKKFGGRYESFSKWDIFKRDGWKCAICGVPTPERLSGSGVDRSPELDHIVPLARGGDHIPSNVQCCCRKCNLAKGDKPLGQIRIF